jgi:hypothetical protein
MRRQILAALVAVVAGGRRRLALAESGPPEKIHLIPDSWDIRHVGRLGDGRLFFVDRQLDYAAGKTRDFVCTFLFSPDGTLVDHAIELIGTRGAYPEGEVGNAERRHLEALGAHTGTNIWVRLFSIESNGAVFGSFPASFRPANGGSSSSPAIRCRSIRPGRRGDTILERASAFAIERMGNPPPRRVGFARRRAIWYPFPRNAPLTTVLSSV